MAIPTANHIVRVNDKVAGDLISLGNMKLKRPVKEYVAINTGNVTLATGFATVDPIPLSIEYDPAEAEGAGELEKSFLAADKAKFEIELSNKATVDGNGTTYTWEGCVVTDFEIAQEENALVIATFTVTVAGLPEVTVAS